MNRIGLALLLVGCGPSAPPEGPPAAPPGAGGGTEHAAVETRPADEAPAATVEDPAPVDPAPAVEVRAAVDPYARVTVSVVNRSGAAVRVGSALGLEREDGAYAPATELGAFAVGEELAEEGCVTLAPGAELRGTWSCLRADAPGLVRDCARAADGRYRFVAVACRGGARTEGEPFDYR